MREAQAAISSREFVDWIAYDQLEPIGPRVVPDLLALLIVQQANLYRRKGARAWLPQDIFPDPLAPSRLSERQEEQRKGQIGADYRRLRAERLARLAAEQEQAEQVH